MAKAGGRVGFHTITPYLIHSDVAGLLAFATTVFGAIETFRGRGAAGGTHVEVRIGDSMLMIGGRDDSEPVTAMLYLYIDDVDAAYKRAMEAGASSLMEPARTDDGERRAGVQDRFGNQWWMGTRLR